MEENKDNFGFGENMPDPDEIREQYSINDDSDTLEPYIDDDEHRHVNIEDAQEMEYWANQFQISLDDLKSAILINGNGVRELKKYLSV
jgi:hypothetical protein